VNKTRYRKKGKARPKNKDVGVRVNVYNNDITSALRRFKKRVEKSQILEEVRARQFYEKPSAKRRRLRKTQKAKFRKNSTSTGK
jgi:small subunit ribosomal protein S21